MQGQTGKLTIDCAALRANYRRLKQETGPNVNVGAVVKANAYGLGAVPIVQELIHENCTHFFVANLEEALALRKDYPDITILIFNGFFEDAANLYTEHNLIPVIGSFMEIKEYKKLAKQTERKLPAYLNFNTRMNRLGLGSVETRELLDNMDMLDGIDIQCVMSHMACADIKDHPMNDTQYEVFTKIAQHFPNAQKSLCNSSSIFRNTNYHFDIARPGMALYGLNPTPEAQNPMQPVISLKAPIIRTRIVYKGAYTGYGATHQFDEDTPLATVATGYADGLPWSSSNQAHLYWQNIPCPIRGRVSMDMVTIDLSAIPETKRPKPGDYLEIIGPNQSPADLAKQANSFDYEILTSLGSRYERHYINQSEPSASLAVDQNHATAHTA